MAGLRRLGFEMRTDGKAEVKNDFAEVGAAGKAAMGEIAEAAEDGARRATAANDEYTKRQLDSFKRQALAAKMAAARADVNSSFDEAVADRGSAGQFATVNLNRSTGTARASAAVFEQAARAEEEAAAGALKLRSALDPLYSAQLRQADELRTANSLLSQGAITEAEHAAALLRSAEAYRAVADAAGVAAERQRALWAEEAAAARSEVAGQARYNRFGAAPLADKSARESAAIFAAAADEEERLANAALKLRAAIDPAFAAQQRFDREMGEARTLIAANVISLDDYCTKLRLEQSALDAVAGSHGRGVVATGAHRQAMQNLSFQAQDVFTQLSMGADVFQVLAIQGGQAAGAFANVGGKAEAVASFLLGPWGLAITAALLVFGPLVSKLFEGNSELDKAVDKLREKAAATETDRQANERWAQSVDGMIEKTRTLTEELTRQLKTQAQMDAEREAQARQYATGLYTGRPGDEWGQGGYRQTAAELAAARRELSEARRAQPQGASSDPAGALALSTSVSQAEQRVQQLEGRLKTLAGAIRDAQANFRSAGIARLEREVSASMDAISAANAKFTEEQGRLREERRQGVISEAQFLEQDRRNREVRDAAIKAEQERQQRARADGRVGTGARITQSDIDDAIRRAGAGDRLGSGTRSVAEQTSLFNRGLTNLDAAHSPHVISTARDVSVRGLSDAQALALRDEIKRQLATAGIRAQVIFEDPARGGRQGTGRHIHVGVRSGTRLSDGTIEAAQVRDAREAEQAAAKLKATLAGLEDQFDPTAAAGRRYREEMAKIAALDLDPAQAERFQEGARAQFLKARAAAFTLPDLEGSRETEERAEEDRVRRRAGAAELMRSEQDRLDMASMEVSMLGASADAHDRVIGRLQLQQSLALSLGDLYDQYAPAILATRDATDEVNARLKVTAAAVDEVRGFGNQLADTLLNPSTWSSWGNAGKTVLNEIKSEFIKLALLNPLKNLINGDSALPTLNSAVTNISRLFTRMSTKAITTGKNASGTEHWSGGMTWVNENGPEIADLPNGTRIYPASETRRMLAGNDNAVSRGDTHVHIHANDAVLADTVRGWVAEGIAISSMRGAAGGAAIGQAEATAAAGRRLGKWR